MQPFQFSYGPRLVAGPGTSARLAAMLPRGRCLFVTDATVRTLGLADAALAGLAAAGIDPVIFDAVEADPSRETVAATVAAGQGCTSVIGFGGGSPMDVAKLAAYLIATGEDLDNLWGVGKATGARLPLALVPTTAGTGSEATPVTVITVGETEKRGVSSAALVPDIAVLDPELTLSLPRAVTAATGIDAMVHAMLAFTDLPGNQRDAWRAMFDHFVFGPPPEHLPADKRGIRGAVSEASKERVRRQLGQMMAR